MTTGDDFIALAGRLATAQNATPVALRTAVSRAYYGAYHLTRQYLTTLAIAPGEEHDLHFDLCNCGNRDANQAGKLLDDLYSRRRLADYKLERADSETENFARFAVELAHEFRSLLNKCRPDPVCFEIATAIKAYRQRVNRIKR
jgi:hypothetical protein